MQKEQLFRKLDSDPEATILKNEILEDPIEGDRNEKTAKLKELREKTLDYNVPGREEEKFLATYEWVFG